MEHLLAMEEICTCLTQVTQVHLHREREMEPKPEKLDICTVKVSNIQLKATIVFICLADRILFGQTWTSLSSLGRWNCHSLQKLESCSRKPTV